ncbi:hypothetical protein APHAL10511_003918 [Amanita phalloides]|nr:hypothetical protein APHAL10511_003918 [Amanita phalloides]
MLTPSRPPHSVAAKSAQQEIDLNRSQILEQINEESFRDNADNLTKVALPLETIHNNSFKTMEKTNSLLKRIIKTLEE